MSTQVNLQGTPTELAAVLAAIWGAKLGGTGDAKPAAAAAEGTGWLLAIAVDGAAQGRIAAWFDEKAARAAAKAALKLEADPKDDALSKFLGEVVAKSADALVKKMDRPGITLGTPVASQAGAPDGATSFDVQADGKVCRVAVQIEIAAAAASATAPSSSRRLEAVLDVDLPLIVRFGRATMPLRALSVLGPGSVIDMGRSPDEPVELLVGDRLIARGEVVVVAGNYGVRITELTTGSQPVINELEARTS
jgi:flagellar motor switch protein FliN